MSNVDAQHGEQHVKKQFIGFFQRRFAVVAGNGNLYIAWNECAFERVDFLDYAISDDDGTGVRMKKARDAFQQCCFPGAVWSDDTDDLPFMNRKRDVRQDSRVTEALAQVFNFQQTKISCAKGRSHNQGLGLFAGTDNMVFFGLSRFLVVSGKRLSVDSCLDALS